MTQLTDDLAAQMVREMQECEGYPTQLITIARRYMEKAVEGHYSLSEIDTAISVKMVDRFTGKKDKPMRHYLESIRAERAGKEPPHDH